MLWIQISIPGFMQKEDLPSLSSSSMSALKKRTWGDGKVNGIRMYDN